jgi:electron-transferring-flavoprotein dehydrogenase
MKNAHDLFLAYKQHPAIRPHLEGGQVLCYGAKLLPEGGYYALPDPVADGVLMTGDCAGLLDAVRLKGIDLAVESGLAAGETLLEACRKDDWSAGSLSRYSERLQAAAGMQRLWRYRNVRAAFQRSMLRGMMTIGLSWLTRGRWPTGRLVAHSDHDLRPVSADQAMPAVAAGGTVSSDPLKVDILSDVFFSGTEHEEDQPCHIDIQDQKRWEQVSAEQYGMPLARCCPGRVYAWDAEKQVLQLEPANCLHCRTCQVKDPLQAVRWRPPEGGGGPRYQRM